jgi:hypothetical protein
MKTLAGALTHRWLVSPDWILESVKQKEFVPEDRYLPRLLLPLALLLVRNSKNSPNLFSPNATF